MNKNTKPRATYFTDDDGQALVAVPVTGSDRPLITEAILYDNARRCGRLSGALYLSDDGRGHRYVYARHPDKRGNSTVARLLIDCRSGYKVRYIDKDPLNLRPQNFRLSAIWADEAMANEALEVLLEAARRSPDGDPGATEVV